MNPGKGSCVSIPNRPGLLHGQQGVDGRHADCQSSNYALYIEQDILRNLQGNKFRIRSKVLSDTVHCVYRSVERGQKDWEVENKIKVLVSNDWQPQISKQHLPLTTPAPRGIVYGTLVKDRL